MTGKKQVSEKQLAANRANARRSTGPRTPKGKAVSRYNALKHGILAQAIIPQALADIESREDFDRLLLALCDHFAPSGAMEELLVQQVAVAYWRLARLYRAEAGAVARRNDSRDSDLSFDAAWRRTPDTATRLLTEQKALRAILDGDPSDREGSLDCEGSLRTFLARYDPAVRDASAADLDLYARDLLVSLEERYTACTNHTLAVEDACRSIPPVQFAVTFARYETSLQSQLDRAFYRLEQIRRRPPLPSLEQSEDA